ncbi:hypothetical protein NG99_04750 [Erwinia typographi]|uniref:Uncharacterized protein n=1 Tax=Erwinia typographi TaxID=371042 RepID=A0A0A3Z8Y3_9GAMM|nr:hypothetical protein [Erwinia typographi]KGT95330.1 hypothetical protein NG99_04750 [Erwinia typographi]
MNERIVIRGLVMFGSSAWYSPLLSSIDGQRVEVIKDGQSDDHLHVFWGGCHFCMANRLDDHAYRSPLKPREKGQMERMVLKRVRQPLHYPMMDDFPTVKVALRADDVVRAIHATERRYRQLRRASKRHRDADLKAVLLNLSQAMERVSRLLGKASQNGGF